MLRRTAFTFLVPLMVTGCTGLSLGENVPGGDTYLELGEIAVDDRTEKSFFLDTITDKEGVEQKSLLRSIDPDSGAVSDVADLTGRDDSRILFPASGILVMSEENDKDELLLLDKDTFEEKAREPVNVRYHGTRMSASREWVAVADNTSLSAPIHILDTQLLTQRVVPHNGYWLEAMWKNQTDELFAIVFYDIDSKNALPARARILSWSMEDVVAGKFEPAEDGFWPARKLDVEVSHVSPDMLFSFTWVGISPDDKWAVFPVQDLDPETPETHALLVVETETGNVRIVRGAKGPVGFTPDSSTIVSYDDNGSQNGPNGETPNGEVDQRLLLIDVNTLEVDPQDVDISGSITYFISRDGNYVVVASNYGGEKLVLHDIDNDKSTQMAGPAVGLDELVSRKGTNELWLLDDQELFKVDMAAGEITGVPTGYPVSHLNILPKRDWLVMSEPPEKKASGTRSASRIHFFDLEAQKTVKTVDIE